LRGAGENTCVPTLPQKKKKKKNTQKGAKEAARRFRAKMVTRAGRFAEEKANEGEKDDLARGAAVRRGFKPGRGISEGGTCSYERDIHDEQRGKKGKQFIAKSPLTKDWFQQV